MIKYRKKITQKEIDYGRKMLEDHSHEIEKIATSAIKKFDMSKYHIDECYSSIMMALIHNCHRYWKVRKKCKPSTFMFKTAIYAVMSYFRKQKTRNKKVIKRLPDWSNRSLGYTEDRFEIADMIDLIEKIVKEYQATKNKPSSGDRVGFARLYLMKMIGENNLGLMEIASMTGFKPTKPNSTSLSNEIRFDLWRMLKEPEFREKIGI